MMIKTDKKAFEEIVKTRHDWTDIDELTDLARAGGVFSPEFYQTAVNQAEKVEVRRLARLKGYYDDDGRQIELVSILRVNIDGKSVRAYKPLPLFDVQDYVLTITDRVGRRTYWDREIQRFYGLAVDRFGKKVVQQLLPFMALNN